MSIGLTVRSANAPAILHFDATGERESAPLFVCVLPFSYTCMGIFVCVCLSSLADFPSSVLWESPAVVDFRIWCPSKIGRLKMDKIVVGFVLVLVLGGEFFCGFES